MICEAFAPRPTISETVQPDASQVFVCARSPIHSHLSVFTVAVRLGGGVPEWGCG